ncbi:hypothetical protein M0E87_03925 [Corynebacterium sp. CCM 9185]|uniref:Uncharacterized protein n=1 Tax=Corynebacterium marambiense TaxID=2765364 RepID=A0ABS0VZT7_9CORY|nr:hypothetical protein [Corynebacterium marambiense]MBI9000918.1 hypothetical protein [Corynebacterium marambiense]MCK7662811.1 hypothetical protein [Corynebacterium marambiense]
MEERIPLKFTLNDFTQLRKNWGIGPAKSGDKKGLPKSETFCLYSPAFKKFVYTPKLLERIVAALTTAEKFEETMGKKNRA